MEIISRYRQMFDTHLASWYRARKPSSLYEPTEYILSLGGKRLRPVFVLMGCGAWSENPGKALPAAMAVELFHNFTLLHDDIMDEADLRRGHATVNRKYGVNAGILSGDVMMIMAYQEILDYSNPSLVKSLMDIFNKMAFEVCEGQQLDVDFEKRDDVAISEYLEMITLKTSVLLGAAMQMGALIGGASLHDVVHIYEFAKNFGIAFQLQDDVLDTFGAPEEVGKKIGGDILRNKKTYLYLKSLELASKSQKETLLGFYGRDDNTTETQKIEAVTSIFRSVNVIEYSRQLIEAYRDLAISHLRATSMQESFKNEFEDIVNKLVFRNT